MQSMELDELLKHLRKIYPHGTQAAAAEKLGFSPAYLSDVLNKRRDPSEKFLKAIGYRRVVSYEATQEQPRPCETWEDA